MKKLTWTLQILLAIAFAGSGAAKLFTPAEALRANPRMGWANEFSNEQIKLIGGAEVVGALGLVLPAAMGVAPVLTPVAAAALGVLMGGAANVHMRRNEPPAVPLVLSLLSFTVAALRFRLRRASSMQTA